MGDKQLRNILILFICGIVLVLIAPYLFTRSLGLLSFKETGTIGDTIGGITAPITSLLGSILVFYALRAQVEANRIMQEQIRIQKEDEVQKKLLGYLLDQFKILREDITDFTYITFKGNLEGEKEVISYLTRKGRDGFRQVIVGMKEYKTDKHLDLYDLNPKLLEIKSIFLAMESLLSQLSNANVPLEDKVFLKNLISYQFDSKIRPAFVGMEQYKASSQKPCSICGKIHIGIPDDLFDLNILINQKLHSI